MHLFYNQHITEQDSSFNFDKDESRHIVKVLRKTIGDTLQITNGKGWLFNAELTLADQKHCSVRIRSKSLQPKRNYNLHLAVAPTKMNDRYEWFLEKATEIGIETITPIFCDHSERKIVKLERFEKIIQSAMKQSLKFTLPKLNKPIKFQDFLKQDFTEKVCIAHCEDGEKKLLKTVIHPSEKTTILIGPEGDFSSDEIKNALEKNCIPISLGESRLRTETAGLVAVQNISFINQ